MAELRPVVIGAQRAMKAGSDQAFEAACSKPGAAEAYERVARLPERSEGVRQPGGEQLDLIGLYKGGLGAVGELWEYGQQAIVASGEAGVTAWWGILKAQPIPAPLDPNHLKYSTPPRHPNPSFPTTPSSNPKDD